MPISKQSRQFRIKLSGSFMIKSNRIFLFLFLFCGFAEKTLPQNKQKDMSPRFEPELIDDQVQIGYGLTIGDVDGDKKPDILLADKKQFVWYRNPEWARFVMVDNLTEKDNVCIAARDIDGDGKVEVAVGGQWNPGETSDLKTSGSVHYLIRPKDPTQLWKPVELIHEPTVHRMYWVKVGKKYQLVVLPLHGRDNKNGEGKGVKILAYEIPIDPYKNWNTTVLDESMHMTHNFDIIDIKGKEALLIGGKEGAKTILYNKGNWVTSNDWLIKGTGFGELRRGTGKIAAIHPMHGNQLALHFSDGTKKILTETLNQGHALAFEDVLGQGFGQVIVGWREKNDSDEMGIMIFVGDDPQWSTWQSYWIDKNGIACEDLKIADLDGDGKKDIIASGRDSHNLKIYWNKTMANLYSEK